MAFQEKTIGGPPSVTDVYRWTWPILWKHFGELLVLSVLWWLLSMPAGLSDGGLSRALALVYQVLVVGPLSFGGLYAYLETVRGRRPEVGLLFTAFQRCYWPSVLAHFLLLVAITVGIALLIVPGVFLAVRLSFVPFLVVDENRDPVDAFRESWRRTAPVALTIFGVMVAAILIALVGFLLLVVGLIPAFMWINLALARLFAEATDRDRRTIDLGMSA
jgi:hypothetical protein